MSLGPYASFITTAYGAGCFVLVILIGWIAIDYRNQTTACASSRQAA